MLFRHERLLFPGCGSRFACYSNKATANYENFKKLRAYPFRVTPEAAQSLMSKTAVSFCSDLGFLASLWTIISSSYQRPLRFSAAYFPAWIVNAEVEADIAYGDARRTGTVIFKNCYVPGSHVPTLSAAPLWANDLNLEEPFSCIIQQPQRDHIQNELSDSESHLFDPSLLEQHGEEVQCIPFTTSPFTLIDIARNLPWTNAVINENFKFIPSSLKVNLFSAYPVLLPLYIAKYEMKPGLGAPGDTLTMWMLAHADWSNLMSENIAVKIHDERRVNLMLKVMNFFGDAPPDSEVFSFLPPDDQVKVSMISSKKAITAVEKWLQKALRSSNNISKLVGTIDNDDDPRIRPMTKAEEMDLQQYFKNENEILLTKRIIEDLKNAGPNVKVIVMPSGKPKQLSSIEIASATLQSKLDSLLTRKEKLKPRWWTEWESLQSQDAVS